MIKKEFPPNIDEIERAFVLNKRAVFSYYPEIYSPSGDITPDLLAHELTHILQQKEYGVERWWRRYIEETAFRLSQEIPAFQRQYGVLRGKIKDRNRLHKELVRLANELSSETYGRMLTHQEAYEAIKKDEVFAFKL